MRRIVELAAASLPWAIRDRYREEWLHDLAHAEEAGVRRGDIAWGAVRTAITADLLQAPSAAHAILQARLRIDAAGLYGGMAMMLTIFAWYGSMWQGVGVVALLLLFWAVLYGIGTIVLLQLAASTLGGMVRLAGPAWLLGMILAGAVGLISTARANVEFWPWFLPAACFLASTGLAEFRKPPKPGVDEHMTATARRRFLLIGAAIGVLSVAIALLDAMVLMPLSRAPDATLAEAWLEIADAGGPASPLVAGVILAGVMLVPVALAFLAAARWARSTRAVLGWIAAASFFAAMVAYLFATFIANEFPYERAAGAPGTVILPLLAGVLIHFTSRATRDLAPLPPASVSLPPGPWHAGALSQRRVPGRPPATGGSRTD